MATVIIENFIRLETLLANNFVTSSNTVPVSNRFRLPYDSLSFLIGRIIVIRESKLHTCNDSPPKKSLAQTTSVK
jgi:hypothetical protein